MQDSIIAAARQCIGTPFRHQGRLPGIGLDCAGIAVHVAQSVGLQVIDRLAYGRVPNQGELEATLNAQPFLRARISSDDRQPGDLLLMRFGPEPMHLAILTGDNTIVHAYESVGSCCEHRLSSVWAARIVGAYQLVETTA